jgi:protein gp37
MAGNTRIEWTEKSWNPVTGCTKISLGCNNCYAERYALRLKAMKNPRYSGGFLVREHEDLLEAPYKWKKPSLIFVNSMSDLFHEKVSLQFIESVFHVMEENPRHVFQILTKRPERTQEIWRNLSWPKNIWLGVTVESMEYLDRSYILRKIGAAVKFISFEPLLSNIPTFDMGRIDWVIVGGETGPGARPMKKDWAIGVRDMCLQNSIPFFFKQWGGRNGKKSNRLLDDREWNQYPTLGRMSREELTGGNLSLAFDRSP